MLRTRANMSVRLPCLATRVVVARFYTVASANNVEERMLAEADGKSAQPIHRFSSQELAQAVAFVLEVQRAEGGLIREPMDMLRFRYGIDYGRACALAGQLDVLGLWAVFIADSGMFYAQVLQG